MSSDDVAARGHSRIGGLASRYSGRVSNFVSQFQGRDRTQQYRYTPLDHGITDDGHMIRVLELIIGPDQALNCEIKHVRLQSAQFWALSYEWGDATKCFTVNIVNKKGRTVGQILLTKNLHNALCSLRDSPDIISRCFWIDQICINQADEQEKNYQVNIMGMIYAASEQVVSYLGPGDARDQIGFALIERLNKKYEATYGTYFADEDTLGGKLMDRDQIPEELRLENDLTKHEWEAMFSIVDGPWTRRIWMIQETCTNFTRDVLMLRGIRTYSWLSFARIHQLFRVGVLQTPLEKIDIATVMVVRMCWQLRASRMGHTGYLEQGAGEGSLASLLLSTGTMECTDPRDRIFALLGLASDRVQLGLLADYSCSYEQVLHGVSVSFLRQYPTKSSGYPLATWTHYNVDDGLRLPSWVARWPSFYYWLVIHNHHWRASGDWTGQIDFSHDYFDLLLPGISVAKIVTTLPSFNKGIDVRQNLEDLARLDAIIAGARSFLQHDPQNCDAIIANTICLGAPWPHSNDSRVQSLNALLSLISLTRAHLEQNAEVDRIEMRLLVGRLSSVEHRLAANTLILRTMRWMALCKTDTGEICMASDKTQVGDVITVLRGMPSLYVLRPVGDKYKFLGAAYMTGWMEGQAIRDPGWEGNIVNYSII